MPLGERIFKARLDLLQAFKGAKVRSGATLTNADIADLQRILVAAGIGDDSTFERAVKKAESFGKFIRGLIGLDRAAAKEAFAEFLDDKRYSKNQIQFVSLIIDELILQFVCPDRRATALGTRLVGVRASVRPAPAPTFSRASPRRARRSTISTPSINS